MAAYITERWNSRPVAVTGAEQSIDLLYNVHDTDDEQEAIALLIATAPATYGTLTFRKYNLTPLGAGLWEATVTYGRSVYSIGFDTTGGTAHLSSSIRTMESAALPGQPVPDFKGAIGVTHDNVEGVDVTVPVFSWTETHYIPAVLVNNNYLAKLYLVTGRVNESAFRTFAAHEVLFLGITGAQRGTDDYELTYRFAASPNVVGVLVGEIGTDRDKEDGSAFVRGDRVYFGADPVGSVRDLAHAQPGDVVVGRAVSPAAAGDAQVRVNSNAKRGWDYLWVRYETAVDLIASTAIRKPVALYIEQVYESGDFTLLGIG